MEDVNEGKVSTSVHAFRPTIHSLNQRSTYIEHFILQIIVIYVAGRFLRADYRAGRVRQLDA